MKKKLPLAVLIASLLAGCGGSDTGTTPSVDTTVPPTDLVPSTPPPVDTIIPPTDLVPSTPPLPTSPCGDNGECLEDDFLTDLLPEIPLTVQISELLNEDLSDIEVVCREVSCSLTDDVVTFTYEYWGHEISLYPLTSKLVITGKLEFNEDFVVEDFTVSSYRNFSGHKVNTYSAYWDKDVPSFTSEIELNPDNLLEDIILEHTSYLIADLQVKYQDVDSHMSYSQSDFLYSPTGHKNVLMIMTTDRRKN